MAHRQRPAGGDDADDPSCYASRQPAAPQHQCSIPTHDSSSPGSFALIVRSLRSSINSSYARALQREKTLLTSMLLIRVALSPAALAPL
jgi:hypothetical protein